jgi:inosose dehydratase
MADQGGVTGKIRLGCQANAWAIEPGRPETLFASLREIAELGFSGFEVGFRNVMQLGDAKEELARERQGLALFGVHIFLHEYDAATCVPPVELAREVAEIGAELGAERLIVSGGPAGHATEAKAAALNELGERARRFGLGFAYHNHGPEMRGAEPEIEVLLRRTDPALVGLLLDAGHAFRAGIDVAEFAGRHAGRLTGVHLRDFQNGQQVPLGDGDFPLDAVARALREKSWSGWVLAEEEREDGSKLGLSVMKPARLALERAFGV